MVEKTRNKNNSQNSQSSPDKKKAGNDAQTLGEFEGVMGSVV